MCKDRAYDQRMDNATHAAHPVAVGGAVGEAIVDLAYAGIDAGAADGGRWVGLHDHVLRGFVHSLAAHEVATPAIIAEMVPIVVRVLQRRLSREQGVPASRCRWWSWPPGPGSSRCSLSLGHVGPCTIPRGTVDDDPLDGDDCCGYDVNR